MADKKKIRLTKADVESRQNELNRLTLTERDEALKQLSEARSYGDLSENSEADAAKARIAEIDARIAQIKEELENYELEETNENIYDIILTNTNNNAQKEIKGLTIGGSVNFDLDNNNIPLDSPLAYALKDTKVGSEATYKVGDVMFKVTVVAIRPIEK